MSGDKSDQDGVYKGNSAVLLYFSTMRKEIVMALSRYTDMAEILDAVVTDLQESFYCQNANGIVQCFCVRPAFSTRNVL